MRRISIRCAPLLCSLFIVGCPPPQCELGEAQCVGEISEVCNSAGRWSFRADCALIDRNVPGYWTCQDGVCMDHDPDYVLEIQRDRWR